jgi:chemotaxis protein histidine kinase CheA
MRNRAMAMTAASPASSNPILAMGRTGVDNGILGTAAYATGHPVIGMALNSGFARNLAGRLLGGRENRTGNIASWLKQGDNAEAFLNKYGNSAANQSAQDLQTGLQQMQNFQGPMPQGTQGSQGAAMQGARQAAAAQAALAKAQAARDAQQAANLTNSVKVRQQQAAARQAAATAQANQAAQAQTTVEAQAAQQAQAEQARAAQYAQQRLQQSASVRQQQAAQAAQQQQEAAAQQAAQAASQQRANQYAQQRQAQSAEVRAAQPTPVDPAVAMAQQAQAAKDRLAARVAARQTANTADNAAKGRTAAAEATAAQSQAKVDKVASGDFSDVDINKPQVKALLDYVDHPDLDSVKASLSALAAQDPAMGKKIVQLLTPGAPNLKKLDFYGIQKRLQDVHGSKVPPESAVVAPQAAAVSGDGALSGAIQNPQAYQAQINRRQAQVSHAVTQAPTPEMAVVAHQMGGESSPAIKQQAFDAVMDKASANEKEYLKKFVEPLIKYGK